MVKQGQAELTGYNYYFQFSKSSGSAVSLVLVHILQNPMVAGVIGESGATRCHAK
jgi:hypothetical protein